MEAKTSLICDLLDCGCLDIDFLCAIIDNNNIELDIEDIKANY